MRRLPAVIAVGAAVIVATPASSATPSRAALAGAWTAPTLVVRTQHVAILADGTTVLFSIGGSKGDKVFERRRTTDGTISAKTLIRVVTGAERCSVGATDVQRDVIAVAVHCYKRDGFEDPPPWSAALVWSAKSGWKSRALPERSVSSLDISPNGRHVAFVGSAFYRDDYRILTWSQNGGFTTVTYPQRLLANLIACIGNQGQLAGLSTVSFEDEPGFFIAGKLRLIRYSSAEKTWRPEFVRTYSRAGALGSEMDMAADGSVIAAIVHSTSDGGTEPKNRRVKLLRSAADGTRSMTSVGPWDNEVLTPRLGVSAAGDGVATWQQGTGPQQTTYVATWPNTSSAPLSAINLGTTQRFDETTEDRRTALSIAGTGLASLAWFTVEGGVGTTHVVAFDAADPGDLAASASTFESEAAGWVATSASSEVAVTLLGSWTAGIRDPAASATFFSLAG